MIKKIKKFLHLNTFKLFKENLEISGNHIIHKLKLIVCYFEHKVSSCIYKIIIKSLFRSFTKLFKFISFFIIIILNYKFIE